MRMEWKRKGAFEAEAKVRAAANKPDYKGRSLAFHIPSPEAFHVAQMEKSGAKGTKSQVTHPLFFYNIPSSVYALLGFWNSEEWAYFTIRFINRAHTEAAASSFQPFALK